MVIRFTCNHFRSVLKLCELKKKHEADLYEAEEKYETLIDRKIICFYYYFASNGYLVS
jgi:hypothetical protein